ncbi:MAG: immunity 17 family protein [Ruminococcus sp.]|nr:immunity 17 family protein [Ruminococcus sp.]
MTEKVVAAVMAAAGLSALICSVINADLYFNLPNSRRLCDRIGRKGARIFNAAAGVIIIVAAVYVMFFA